MSDTDRLDALERRVAELEKRLTTSEPQAAVTPDPSAFWALEGLLARVDDPGAVMITGHVTLPDGRAARWQEAVCTGELLDGDWSQHVTTLAALAHPARIRLLQHVLHGAATAQDLTHLDGMGTSGQVYHHLRQLVAAGWLQTVGGGRYEVPVARVVPLLTTILGARR
ncbi:DNA-binding transcriptional ArsR family regulator [Actinoplanes campanulatus]|uniref:DNA-binding transcriptional ArsR family regulator n=1 Tax=Actinoplanes campanulatus TaxID=113559 RepID=A0A7W5FEU5_9ACTN|nr:winged helix-turn-helix domain-containing protein [Actinoplanes campanulatus]MBB3095695.1 DNA-binding transcriptional ArsR family regulator [Actinoplanes campanulatus]GGN10883.1 transcriptional regulator [Actinoplanes campanulatus]GID36590.1 transcriptional regulator [Actinoplanes campanulatus]